MLLRAMVFAAATVICTETSAVADTRNVQEVFRDFENICFSYAESGSGLELTLLIEQAGFVFVEKAKGGSDIFNSDIVQLVINEKTCAFGMPQLPFELMLEWTKDWATAKGLVQRESTKTHSGGQYWSWSGGGFDIGLEEDEFTNGVPLTALILLRK